jgi:lysozyme
MLNGIDISSWQGNIDVSKVPCDFVIIKSTGGGGNGKGYVNPYCDSRFQLAKKSGKLLGVYHYAHEIGYQGSAIEEADFFLKKSKGYLNGDAIPVLDWESDNKYDVNWALAWLDRVYQKTGIRPWFYTYTAVINAKDFSKIAKAGYGLWIANYGINTNIAGYKQPSPPKSNGFSVTACFQYSSQTYLSGYSGALDANVFYGDEKAWKAYANPNSGSKPNPIPTPEKPPVENNGGIKMKEITLNSNVNLRTAAKTSAPVIALLKKGDKVKFDDIVLAGGYMWGVQPRGNGTKGYLSLGKIDAYGSIK